jgi:hypothetical protein
MSKTCSFHLFFSSTRFWFFQNLVGVKPLLVHHVKADARLAFTKEATLFCMFHHEISSRV